MIIRTLSTISELHMRRPLRSAKRIEHLRPRAPNPEGQKDPKAQAKQ